MMGRLFALLTAACVTSLGCSTGARPLVAAAPNPNGKPPCFRDDAATIRDAFAPDAPRVLTLDSAADLEVLRSRVADAMGPLTIALQAHGLSSGDSILNGSGMAVEGGTLSLKTLFESPRRPNVPWMVVLAGGCSTSWVDLRSSKVPSSIVSFANDDMVASCGTPPTSCDGPSRVAMEVAKAIGGAADLNGDCLVTDIELADAVNEALRDCVPISGVEHKAFLRVAQQANGQIPVRRLGNCATAAQRTYEKMLATAGALGGEIATSVARQVRIARGELESLPETAFDYYVTENVPPAVEAAAERRGLRRFPGILQTAERVARFSTSIVVHAIRRVDDELCVRQLPPSSESPRCYSLARAESVDDMLPSRGSIEAVFPSRRVFKVNFRGEVPRDSVVVGKMRFELQKARPSTCSVHGQCFDVTYDGVTPIYVGAPVWRAAP